MIKNYLLIFLLSVTLFHFTESNEIIHCDFSREASIEKIDYHMEEFCSLLVEDTNIHVSYFTFNDSDQIVALPVYTNQIWKPPVNI